MTATYTNSPGTRNIDAVRLLIYDRDTIPETDALLQDEEIQFFIDGQSNIRLAAAEAAEAIGAKFAGSESSKKVGDLWLDFGGGRTMTYGQLATQLRLQAARRAAPFAGGLTKSGKSAVAKDTDRVHTVFRRGMDDHERTGAVENERGILEF